MGKNSKTPAMWLISRSFSAATFESLDNTWPDPASSCLQTVLSTNSPQTHDPNQWWWTTRHSVEIIGVSLDYHYYCLDYQFCFKLLDLPSGKHTKKLWKITIFHGNIHYRWWFSIVMLNYRRVFNKTSKKIHHSRHRSQRWRLARSCTGLDQAGLAGAVRPSPHILWHAQIAAQGLSLLLSKTTNTKTLKPKTLN